MSSYIGVIAIDNVQHLIGSTLFGICNSAANEPNKKVILNSFDQLHHGITVHIKFTSGNTIDTNPTLQFYADNTAIINNTPTIDLAAVPVTGSFICATNSVIAFTFEDTGTNKYWRVNNSVEISESANNGQITVNGQNIPIHGLGTAAYTDASAYATSAQGTAADNAMPRSGGTFTGAVTFNDSVTLNHAPTASSDAATKGYVDSKTQGLDGLTSAMHFKGIATSLPEGSTEPSGIAAYEGAGTMEEGDVVVYGQQEYVWTGSAWALLGDEGSYALKSSTDIITEVASLNTVTVGTASGWNPGGQASLSIQTNTNTAASLTENQVQIPNVTNAGSATTASVAAGILNITLGQAPTIDANPIIVKEIGTFTPNVPVAINFTTNTLPQLTVGETTVSRITTSNTEVVVPNNSNNNP